MRWTRSTDVCVCGNEFTLITQAMNYCLFVCFTAPPHLRPAADNQIRELQGRFSVVGELLVFVHSSL